MRKLVSCVAGILAISAFSSFVLFAGHLDAQSEFRIREEEAKIVHINGDIIMAEDSNGNLWEYYGDGVKLCDRVMLVIDSNGTDSLLDDMVIDVK